MKKKRSSSSYHWIKKHFNDQYVQEAHSKKLRSRAWFKLEQINKSEKIFKNGMIIIDLGSSPGGWSQYAQKYIQKKGMIISCDIMPMKPIQKVKFFQGDFFDSFFLEKITKCLNNKKAHIIMSDMSPNLSGISAIDIPKSINLLNSVLNFSCNFLRNNGTLLTKTFLGKDFDQCFKNFHSIFKEIKIIKPIASKLTSREVYILAKERH
ncbi:RlmE family RNA methyltransferase [Candidatus Tachikawaea gelatinosa]|uniref:Ribosomal RNA large subunit methyltransferase E n=1 Tax=Candidatus Tachikawaea gelatinosa TaxID=1410383 RepID=A0A090AK89_9ENTR|nr:SAM-dependent methyltransferase [Candidatus Tachikawaea gelatinosa]BAP58853.1 ribosomal RNA large subunit methyltransferase E [Candidatus Tachikawaea gelatinosa]